MSNFLEYALETDPKDPSSLSNLDLKLESDLLGVKFYRVADPSLRYEILDSNDLKTWSTVWAVQGDEGATGTIIFEETIESETSAGKRFLKLRIFR